MTPPQSPENNIPVQPGPSRHFKHAERKKMRETSQSCTGRKCAAFEIKPRCIVHDGKDLKIQRNRVILRHKVPKPGDFNAVCHHKLYVKLLIFVMFMLLNLGGAKVSCILCHRGVQLILAYSWARPAILVAGKGREVMFLFLLFLHFHSCSSFFPVPLFHLFCYLFCLFSSFLWETTQNDPQGLTCR